MMLFKKKKYVLYMEDNQFYDFKNEIKQKIKKRSDNLIIAFFEKKPNESTKFKVTLTFEEVKKK